jgi:hypothetical protein
VWVPKDAESLIAAAEEGALDEKHDFDAKRELPGNNKELAKDIAAMTTDGGVLIYGLGEDDDHRPRLPMPIKLAGVAERIDNVAQSSISGNPRIESRHLRLAEDGSRGFIAVVVPASPDAPHQVMIGGDRRFYGRSDTGNRRLSEEEIARLYERRASRSADRDRLLEECVARAPFGEPPAGELGFLQAFIRPAVPDDGLWERATEAEGSEDSLKRHLRDAATSAISVNWGGPELGGAVNWRRRGSETWSLTTTANDGSEEHEARHAVRADIDMDGNAYLFFGSAAEARDRNGHSIFVLFEKGIALTLVQFFRLAGTLFSTGGLYGPVDVGFALTGIEGSISARTLRDLAFPGAPFGRPSATRAERRDAGELLDDPAGITHSLTRRLFNASTGFDFDPLAEG